MADHIPEDQQQADVKYRQMRETWCDYNRRQEFEHSLINRRTTWLLTSQTILFAAYGVSFTNDTAIEWRQTMFRIIVGFSGVAIAALVSLGVSSAIQAKRQSWTDYYDYFAERGWRDLPDHPELVRGKLEWGVRTKITERALILDKKLPIVFILAWVALVISEAASLIAA